MTLRTTGADRERRPTEARPVLALDFGGTQLRAAVVLPDGSLRGRISSPTPRRTAAPTVVDECIRLLDSARQAQLALDALQEGAPWALGISAPGPLDPLAGVLRDPPNLDQSLWGFALVDALSAATGLPAVLDKDTNVAALAEGRFGAARGVSHYVYMTVSTGVGGAVVSDGRLVAGADGAGGELGHLMIDPSGPLCGCGVRGHLEAIGSGTGIAAAVDRALQGGEIVAGTPLAEIIAARGAEWIGARAVAQAEDEGDPVAARIMDAARDAFASAMVTVTNVFNPQRIVVGGGIALGQRDRLLEPARRRVAEQAFRVQAARVDIVPSQLGDDVGLIGALALVGERLGASADGGSPDRKPAATTAGRLALTNGPAGDHDSGATLDSDPTDQRSPRPAAGVRAAGRSRP